MMLLLERAEKRRNEKRAARGLPVGGLWVIRLSNVICAVISSFQMVFFLGMI